MKESCSCKIEVTSKLDVHTIWYLDEEILKSGENIVLSHDESARVYNLLIKSVPQEFAGKLTAVVQNKAGSTSTTCAIHVNSMLFW